MRGREVVAADRPSHGLVSRSLRRDLAGPLRGLIAGQCLGQCADGLAQIAFAQFVLFDVGRGATPGRIAAVLAVTLLPFSVVGPFAGVFLDRFDRRRTLIAVSLVRTALVVGGAAVVTARATPAAYVLVLLLLSASRLVLTAKGAALPRTVPRERLVPANALSAAAGTASTFVGAAAGSQLVSRSTGAGFLLAGLLYAFGALVFARLPYLGGRHGDPMLPRLRRTVADLGDGVRVAAGTPEIRRPLLSVASARWLLGAGFVVLVLVADSQYRLRTSGYGVALAVTGVAAFVGSVAAPPLAARFGARTLLPAGFFVAAGAAYVGGLMDSLWVLVPCVGVVALAFQVLKVSADALIGGASPDALRGRVFAGYDVLYNLAFVLAGLAMVPWWHVGRERALLWWVAAGFTVGGLVLAGFRPRLRRPVEQVGPVGARCRGRGLAVLAGALPTLAFPGPAWWWLAWFALVPLTLLVRAAPTRREAMVRAWWGLGAFEATSQYWLLPNIGPALLLLSALLGMVWLPWGWTVHRLLAAPIGSRRAALALVAVPAAWTCAEAVRSWQSLGGPWALLGASQWHRPVLLASASLGGVWLTGWLIGVVNTALVVAVLQRRLRQRALALLVAGACVAVGPAWYVLRSPEPVTGVARVAVVQPGAMPLPVDQQDAEFAATSQLPPRGLDLIVWGESSVVHEDTASLQSLAQRTGADLLVNGNAPKAGSAGIYKESVLVTPAGPAGSYEKIRLVPFGEYIPLRSVLGWAAHISRAAPTNRLRGDHTVVLHTSRFAFGPLICFESAFPDLARHEVAHRAQLLVYQSSTSTFQGSWAQPQHASLAAVRAAETGRPVVHAALTGDSAVFAADGRQLAWQPSSYRGAFTVDIPLAAGTTPYQQAGDWLLAVAFTTLAATAAYAVLRPTGRWPPGSPVR